METEKLYPVKLKLENTIGDGFIGRESDKRRIIDTTGAVTLSLEINNCDYPKKEVYDAVRELIEATLKYFE